MSKTILVMPAYNEAERIGNVLKRTVNFVDQIIVVDDGSTDQTELQIPKGNKIMALRHKTNLGKGAALLTGCQAALQLGADIVITMDADGQHPPEIIPIVLNKMRRGQIDAVFCARMTDKNVPLIRDLGNKVLNKMAYFFFSSKLNDVWCGFRFIHAPLLQQLKWRADYSGEVEMVLKILKNNPHYMEYLIPAIYHDRHKGVNIIHGLHLLLQIIFWRITL